MKLTLLSLLAFSAFAQTNPPAPQLPPDPPACLTAPVTKGTITLSCSMIDATSGSDFSYGYIFGIKASSSDPEVVALRVELTTVTNPLPDGTLSKAKRLVTVLKGNGGSFSYAFVLMPTYDIQGLNPSPTAVASIKVEELKPSNSVDF
jgi:hypothetical protein